MARPDDPAPGQEFLTTREVAAYLRIKERRVYELVRRRAIPCTRVTGKWLFPKALVDLWLAEAVDGDRAIRPPPVIAGSHDPLLDWAVKESGCALALLPGGSLDGIARFAQAQAMVAGLHLFDADSGEFNLPALGAGLAGPPLARQGVVLLEWAWRRQGLVVAAGNPHGVRGLRDLKDKGLRVIRRQKEAGSHLLLAHLLEREGLDLADLAFAEETARGETDLGLAILEGGAEAGLAVEAVARTLRLGFVPLMRERYDLLLRRRDYFEPPLQTLFAFARSEAFAKRAAEMGGYEVTGLGTVRYNGP
ncbi:MAG: substrate-binding domain-containing protein [Kiloniellaceae bacterium]